MNTGFLMDYQASMDGGFAKFRIKGMNKGVLRNQAVSMDGGFAKIGSKVE